MAIGNQGSHSTIQLNDELGSIALAIRNDSQRAIQFFQGINNLGVAGLIALGYSNQDATNFLNAVGHLNTVAQVYYGLAQQTPAFNFDDSLSEARGGM